MKRNKVIILPLDERPCNYYYPQIMPRQSFDLVVPDIKLLGAKKTPAKFDGLKSWLIDNVRSADCLIVSMDMLLYGGIVPSRLHHLSLDEIKKRADLIEELKKLNPALKIYAFQLIMRCPSYSLSDEEPDYYDYCGKEIHHYGRCKHLESLSLLTDDDRDIMQNALKVIKPEDLIDYEERRKKNAAALMHTLEKVKSGSIDYFIMPQDDAAVYGYTALDQIKVRSFITGNSLHLKASMYPGADEIGMTLLSRYVNMLHNNKPKIFAHYASSQGGMVVPSFEDRIIDETVKHQIYAAGGVRVYSLHEADILLSINIGNLMDGLTDTNRPQVLDVNRNLAEFTEQIKYALSIGKAVAIADVAVPNGGDLELAKLLDSEGLLFKVNSYAGWNTSSNTMGTAICQCIMSLYEPVKNANDSFLVHRYAEDIAYGQCVRQKVRDEYLGDWGLDYFNSGEKDGKVARVVEKEILAFLKDNLKSVFDRIEKIRITMPWTRMFEIDLKIECKN